MVLQSRYAQNVAGGETIDVCHHFRGGLVVKGLEVSCNANMDCDNAPWLYAIRLDNLSLGIHGVGNDRADAPPERLRDEVEDRAGEHVAVARSHITPAVEGNDNSCGRCPPEERVEPRLEPVDDVESLVPCAPEPEHLRYGVRTIRQAYLRHNDLMRARIERVSDLLIVHKRHIKSGVLDELFDKPAGIERRPLGRPIIHRVAHKRDTDRPLSCVTASTGHGTWRSIRPSCGYRLQGVPRVPSR